MKRSGQRSRILLDRQKARRTSEAQARRELVYRYLVTEGLSPAEAASKLRAVKQVTSNVARLDVSYVQKSLRNKGIL